MARLIDRPLIGMAIAIVCVHYSVRVPASGVRSFIVVSCWFHCRFIVHSSSIHRPFIVHSSSTHRTFIVQWESGSLSLFDYTHTRVRQVSQVSQVSQVRSRAKFISDRVTRDTFTMQTESPFNFFLYFPSSGHSIL